MQTMTKRATKGGEYGANGEWYEGGKFINTIAQNHKLQGSRPARKASKSQYEPFKWAFAPEGKTSIYAKIEGLFGKVYNRVLVIDTNERTLKAYGRTIEWCNEMAERYNRGERWI